MNKEKAEVILKSVYGETNISKILNKIREFGIDDLLSYDPRTLPIKYRVYLMCLSGVLRKLGVDLGLHGSSGISLSVDPIKKRNTHGRYLNGTQITLTKYIKSMNDCGIGAKVLLYGPPGTGKTSYVDYVNRVVGGGQEVDKIEDKDDIYKYYQAEKRFCLIDEVDIFIEEDQSILRRLLSFLEDPRLNVFLITNNPEKLPDKLTRSGRINKKVEFDLLLPQERKPYLKALYRLSDVDSEWLIGEVLKREPNPSQAALKGISEEILVEIVSS